MLINSAIKCIIETDIIKYIVTINYRHKKTRKFTSNLQFISCLKLKPFVHRPFKFLTNRFHFIATYECVIKRFFPYGVSILCKKAFMNNHSKRDYDHAATENKSSIYVYIISQETSTYKLYNNIHTI